VYESQTTELNTLALIREWSMDGADADLNGRFGSPVDIHALVAEYGESAGSEARPPEPSSVLMKPAGEDDWTPLLAGNSDPE
jgi:hypothetical protein